MDHLFALLFKFDQFNQIKKGENDDLQADEAIIVRKIIRKVDKASKFRKNGA